MSKKLTFCGFLLLLLSTAPTFSATTGVGWFAVRTPGTENLVPITTAKLGDKINYLVKGAVADGDHSLLFRIYDGAGREAFRGESTVTARKGLWGTGIGYGLKPETDAPGTWWFVVELDGQTVLSSSLEVTR